MRKNGRSGLEEGRDRAVEGVGNGAENFGFARLNERIEGDGLGAGGEDVLLYLRNGLREAVEGGAEMRELALSGREPGDFGTGNPA
jgi:hypothetical protein